MINRRGLLLGLGSALAAPAIVHAGNLMPVKVMEWVDPWRVKVYFDDGMAVEMVPADGLMLCNFRTKIRHYRVFRYGETVGGGWMQGSSYIKPRLTTEGNLTVDTNGGGGFGIFSAEGCDNWLRASKRNRLWINSDVKVPWEDQSFCGADSYHAEWNASRIT